MIVLPVGYSWLEDWAWRVELSIDASDVDAVLTNHTVLVYLTNSTSGISDDDVSFIFDEVMDEDKKIVFTDAADNLLYAEIEEWNNLTEQAWLWVRVPTIDSAVDTVIYLYFDMTKDDNVTHVGDVNSIPGYQAWDDDYLQVLHCSDGSGTSDIYDSTRNSEDGTKQAANEPNVDSTTVQIYQSQYFDGSDYISFSTDLLTEFTITAWFYDDGSAAEAAIYAGNVNKYAPLFAYDPANDQTMATQNAANGYIRTNAASVATTTWYWVGYEVDGADHEAYLNGVSHNSNTEANGAQQDTTHYMGMRDTNEMFLTGNIDELRVSLVRRGAPWQRAAYQSGIDNLIEYGAAEEMGVEPPPEPEIDFTVWTQQTMIWLIVYCGLFVMGVSALYHIIIGRI